MAEPTALETESKPPTIDLREQTFQILANTREPTQQELEALVDRFTFVPTDAKSLGDFAKENPGDFSAQGFDGLVPGEREPNELIGKYATKYSDILNYVPPAMVVGLNADPKSVIAGSEGKNQVDQLALIEDSSRALQAEFPDARLVMLPISSLVQGGKAYKEVTGKPYLLKKALRTLDQTKLAENFVADTELSGKVTLSAMHARFGSREIYALPALVFVKK